MGVAVPVGRGVSVGSGVDVSVGRGVSVGMGGGGVKVGGMSSACDGGAGWGEAGSEQAANARANTRRTMISMCFDFISRLYIQGKFVEDNSPPKSRFLQHK